MLEVKMDSFTRAQGLIQAKGLWLKRMEGSRVVGIGYSSMDIVLAQKIQWLR